MTIIVAIRQQTGGSGPEAMRLFAFCAAVPGTAIHSSSARRTATGSYPTTATALSGFVLRERFNLLPLYLFTS